MAVVGRWRRVALYALAALAGWTFGVYVYFLLAWIIHRAPQPGDIHIGAGPSGAAGVWLFVHLARRRWGASARDRTPRVR